MLPESVCAGVRYQHAPELAGEHEPYAQVIALSGQLLAGQNPWEEDEAVAESFAKLQIDRETAGEAMDVIRDSAEDLEAIALTMAG